MFVQCFKIKMLCVLSIIIKSKEGRLGSRRDTRITYTQIKTLGFFPEQIIPNLSFCLSVHSSTNVCFLETRDRNPHSQVHKSKQDQKTFLNGRRLSSKQGKKAASLSSWDTHRAWKVSTLWPIKFFWPSQCDSKPLQWETSAQEKLWKVQPKYYI